MSDELPIEYELLKDVVALNLKVLDTKIEHFMENTHVKIVMQDVDEEEEDENSNVIESCAWGLIYALGVLSFADARPRGARTCTTSRRTSGTSATCCGTSGSREVGSISTPITSAAGC